MAYITDIATSQLPSDLVQCCSWNKWKAGKKDFCYFPESYTQVISRKI